MDVIQIRQVPTQALCRSEYVMSNAAKARRGARRPEEHATLREVACSAVAAPQTGPSRGPGVSTGEASLEDVPLRELFEAYARGYNSIGTDTETDCMITDVEGEIPPELTGTLLRNGPAMFDRNGFKKEFLDGDGMITSVAFKDGKAYFRNKFVRTPSFQKEEKDSAFSSLSIFTAEDPRPLQSGLPVWKHRLIDDIFNGPPSPKNNAAYNVWNWAGSLVAVDFGMPHGLDRETLDTVAPYSSFSAGKFTAHNRIVKEADGSLRNCCFSPEVDWATSTTTLGFREYDEAGVLVSDKVYKFGAAYFHDMVVTDKWYIVFDCPIKMDLFKTFIGYPFGLNSLGDTISEDRSKEPVFRMFPRRHDGPMVEVVAKGMHCFAYHHINGFDLDESGEKVIFDTCTWDVFSLYFKDIVEPDGVNHFPRTKVSRFELDTKTGVATHHVLDRTPCEYPTVAPKATGVPYKHAYMSTSAVSKDGVNGPMQQLTKVTFDRPDTESGAQLAHWLPGTHKFVGEPLFVARPGSASEDDGWLLLLVHDGDAVSTELAILDAQKVPDGPVATLKLPRYIPMGVHGSWSEEYILGPPTAAAA